MHKRTRRYGLLSLGVRLVRETSTAQQRRALARGLRVRMASAHVRNNNNIIIILYRIRAARFHSGWPIIIRIIVIYVFHYSCRHGDVCATGVAVLCPYDCNRLSRERTTTMGWSRDNESCVGHRVRRRNRAESTRQSRLYYIYI